MCLLFEEFHIRFIYVVYVDVMFAMNSSSNMSWNDSYGYRKNAAKNFVASLLTGGRAEVVDIDSYSRLIRTLTSDFDALNSSINSLGDSG
ncbi:MAG: VWA domain-containing protein [Euryarchaeota archaeon]|nr:VWA domain-containing protein [Euryarchaeota archaeon]